MGPATLKAREDVASNRENIPGRGWGVGMVPEHTRWEKPPESLTHRALTHGLL